MIYFDSNATTRMAPSTIDSWVEASNRWWHNPSSPSRSAATARARLQEARNTLANQLGIPSEHLIFCSGATEACNLWIDSFFRSPSKKKLFVSKHEHACIRRPLEKYQEMVVWFDPLELRASKARINDAAAMKSLGGVVMMAANNETGSCYSWREIAELCEALGVPYFCDMTQWIGKKSLNGISAVSSFCASAHKFCGPKGIGFLKIDPRFFSAQGIQGGQQEQGMRAGTENLPSTVAMVQAFEISNRRAHDQHETIQRNRWKQSFIEHLKAEIPELIVVGESREALWNTVFLIMPSQPQHWWIQELEREGFEVSSGSACQSQSGKASATLESMGFSREQSERGIRISSGWDTSQKDWQKLAKALISVFKKIPAARTRSQVISIEDL